jgi:hypothetical protein
MPYRRGRSLPARRALDLRNHAADKLRIFERAVCGYAIEKTNGRGHAMQKVSVNAK